MDKIVWKSSEICTFLKILNFNFPHIMLSSTTEKICSSCWLKENFNNKNFSFSFENLRIFEDIRRICNLRRSSKNFWFNEDSSYSSSVYFQKPKNLRIRLRSIFNLRCNTDMKLRDWSLRILGPIPEQHFMNSGIDLESQILFSGIWW